MVHYGAAWSPHYYTTTVEKLPEEGWTGPGLGLYQSNLGRYIDLSKVGMHAKFCHLAYQLALVHSGLGTPKNVTTDPFISLFTCKW